MIAPNPHWWKEEAETYYYPRGVVVSWTFFLGMILVWADASMPHQKGVGWFFVTGMLIIVVGWIVSAVRAERSGFRLETRHTFLTLYSRGSIVAHEDMRLLRSLEPVFSKKGPLAQYCATFESGTTISIFADLENFDALIEKLKGYQDSKATAIG